MQPAVRKTMTSAILLTLLLVGFNNCSESLDTSSVEAELNQQSTSVPVPPPITTPPPVDDSGTINPPVEASAGSPSMSLSAFSVASGQMIQISVSGGTPPFAWTVTPSSGGSVAAAGAMWSFTGNQAGATGIRVTDALGLYSEVAVNVTGGTTVPASLDCTSPWGSKVLNGSSVKAWQRVIIGGRNACASQSRKCTNGVLSGSFTLRTCNI